MQSISVNQILKMSFKGKNSIDKTVKLLKYTVICRFVRSYLIVRIKLMRTTCVYKPSFVLRADVATK